MPFGLRNVSVTFQCALDKVLIVFRWQRCLIYLYDVIGFSVSDQEHMEDVESILKLLRNSAVTLKPTKWSLLKQKVHDLVRPIPSGKLEVASAMRKEMF